MNAITSAKENALDLKRLDMQCTLHTYLCVSISYVHLVSCTQLALTAMPPNHHYNNNDIKLIWYAIGIHGISVNVAFEPRIQD